MKYIINLFIILSLCFSYVSRAEENTRIGFISDDLFLYFHSGPGSNYRILGSMNAGDEIKVLSDTQNDYIHIEDSKGRKGWIDVKYLSDMPGLRVVVAELNEELANKSVQVTDLNEKLSVTTADLESIKNQLANLKTEKSELEKKFAEASKELDNKELNTNMTYFKYGAAVLLIGLLFGLLVPRFFVRKQNYSSWN